MKISPEKLYELFVRPGHIPEVDFESAKIQAEKEQRLLEDVLCARGFISDENLGKVIADSLGFAFIDLKKTKISEDLLRYIPEIVARTQRAIVFDRAEEDLKVATSDPENFSFLKFLEKKTGEHIMLYYATERSIEEALRFYKKDLGALVGSIIQDLALHPDHEDNVVRLVNLFLEYAYDNRASDIHIEPQNADVIVRFRIDGVLHEVATYPKELHDKIVFRIKIMAKLRTDEHAAAQDGRFDFKTDNFYFDVRVSVLPVTDGENVVLRLLSERSRRLTLEELGFLEHDLLKIKRASAKPYGMILAAGPTGSGKTTTLYALLQIMNKPEVNIMTIEDPVEYDIEGVAQTQVNPKKNLTFATGLRSIVRQDPNIIMVGEIRDAETADIAVNAAMTGHLLLSTMHANDSATAFPRLMEMGAEPFLIASSVNVIVAQRLVRKICSQCRESRLLSDEEIRALNAERVLFEIMKEASGTDDISRVRVYGGTGCKACGNTGYSGRTGIFEVLEVIEELRPLIVQKESADVIARKTKELGMTSMLHDGVTKMFQGITTLEEILRTTKS